MKKKLYLVAIIALLGLPLSACKGNNESKPVTKNEQGAKRTVVDNKRVAAFLAALQKGDKGKMYEASNLTPEIVNNAREKLIHRGQQKLSEQQQKEYEHSLRISGNIDFMSSKMKKIFMPTAVLQITKSVDKGSIAGAEKSEHTLKVIYQNKDNSIADKSARSIKEMTLHLQQITLNIEGRAIHEFSFDSKEFDKMADKEFEVISYF